MHSRHLNLSALFVVLSIGSPVFAQEKEAAEPTALQKSAAAFVQLLEHGKFEQATQSYDEAMRKALPAEQLKATWETTVTDAGEFKKQLQSRLETGKEYDTVVVICEFAKAQIDARVVFDKSEKITGLFFRPSSPAGQEEIWEGTLDAGVAELRLRFHLFTQEDGKFAATVDSLDQDSMGIVLDVISVQDDAIHFEHTGAEFEFDGKLSKDRGEITGEFSQGGQIIPLTLKKVEKPKDPGPEK